MLKKVVVVVFVQCNAILRTGCEEFLVMFRTLFLQQFWNRFCTEDGWPIIIISVLLTILCAAFLSAILQLVSVSHIRVALNVIFHFAMKCCYLLCGTSSSCSWARVSLHNHLDLSVCKCNTKADSGKKQHTHSLTWAMSSVKLCICEKSCSVPLSSLLDWLGWWSKADWRHSWF